MDLPKLLIQDKQANIEVIDWFLAEVTEVKKTNSSLEEGYRLLKKLAAAAEGKQTAVTNVCSMAALPQSLV
ncbi:MAG: hypothetical protein K2W95_19100 [Candidatus Obscuribacterales bacterium]|nr:hypothetical protein [Candidatus Obscuribacterales bacterium]